MNSRQLRRYNHRKREKDRKWAKAILKSKGAGPLAKLWAMLILDSEANKASAKYNWWERTGGPIKTPAGEIHLVTHPTFAEKSK